MVMEDYEFKRVDFDNPSFLFILEDRLKGLLGCPFYYDSYFRSFGLKGDERVLDFGCGGGAGSRCLLKLLSKRGHLTCVDVSNFWIERARKRLGKRPNLEFRAGDIRNLKIPDSSFDVVYTIHTLHDIEPAERQGIVNAISGKMRPGAAFFVREPTKKSHGMPVEEIQTLLSNAGLKENEHNQIKSEYWGTFQKPNDS
jgi:ubiquinone/menaquinone biosynthesis C-methylase UbiE